MMINSFILIESAQGQFCLEVAMSICGFLCQSYCEYSIFAPKMLESQSLVVNQIATMFW